jgi:preprotein translocase subunit SecG
MIFQAVVSVLLILFVLLQFGKGAEAGLMGSTDSVMSTSQHGNIMSKITIVLVVLFLGNSILLARLQRTIGSNSIFEGEAPVARQLNNDKAAAEAAAKAVPAATTETAPVAAPTTATPVKK